MSLRFAPGDVELLRTEQEIKIETSSASGTAHRTIIWVVVDDLDRVLVRSYLGSGARWFREISQRPDGRLQARGRVLDVRAVPATDDERVAACSEGFARKYAGQHSVNSMITRYLETTLELVPR